MIYLFLENLGFSFLPKEEGGLVTVPPAGHGREEVSPASRGG